MATDSFEAVADSYINKLLETDNFGSDTFVRHGPIYGGGDKATLERGIVNFDVSSLAGATINSAKMVREIWSIANGGQGGQLSRCTRPAGWVESEVTWLEYSNGNAWTEAGGDFDDTGPPAKITYTEPASTGTHEVTGLKDFVEDALDNRSGIVSLITRLVDEIQSETTSYFWRSKEYGSNIWRLVIDYTPVLPTSPGRRSRRRTAFGSGAQAASPAQPATGIGPARPHRPRRRA